MLIPPIGDLLSKAWRSYNEDNAGRLAAAFSFFAILALAPLLVFAVFVVGQIYGSDLYAQHKLLSLARDQMGEGTGDFLKTLITNAHKPGAGVVALSLSGLVALYGASSLFSQLSDAINAIWGVAPVKGSAVKNFILAKAASIVMVLVFAVFVLGWMVLDAVIGAGSRASGAFPGWPFVSLLVSTLFLTAAFAVAFKGMPRGMVAWGDTIWGAFLTALGFSVAKFALSLYFTYTHVASAYGPAGALVLVLLWIYYSAQIFFFGAEVVYVTSHEYGSQRDRLRTTETFS